MTTLEWAAQIAVILLLGATLPMAWRLDRMLRALRGDRAALEQGATGLGDASAQAGTLLVRLRAATELGARQVNERIAAAEATRDDLRYLLERAEALADRLEGAIQSARPVASQVQPVRGEAARSDAERDLIRALGLPR